MVQKRAVPTIKRRRVGAQLRRWRGSMKSGDAAKMMGWDITRLSRIERGTYRVSSEEVRAFAAKLGVDDPEGVEEVALAAEEPAGAGWWVPYTGHVQADLLDFVQMEAEADVIRVQHHAVVPGLLQSPAYIREIIGYQSTANSQTLGMMLNLRLARQSVLGKLKRLHAVVPEAALYPKFDQDPGIMRDQMRRLIDATEMPNIDIQVLPLTSHPRYGSNGAITTLSFKHPWAPVASVDGPTGGAHTEEAEMVAFLAGEFEKIAQAALPYDESRVLLREHLERLHK
ncbi:MULTISPECIES: helix-turn-helix transcriptional regulator [unclassified Streptomyces]|uniref:helix-turn-helix domain-containing protein n=1 Tax=unclassified Streptomyces TaxID=2593676 RepID=UPI000B873793|nr:MULTISPECIES: helix-turn-helix transcriptional regulator [unclassified Streptomyces]MYR30182.1 helix-turn-helix domain-containing protein [Streptomyces sp. SID4945]WEH28337.1 helix-turn-helix transcriptional regulator [Streptomyces sp. AM 3-1-1]